MVDPELLKNIKKENIRTAYSYIRKQKLATRQELSKELDLSLSSITRIVTILSELGLIEEKIDTECVTVGSGRKSLLLKVAPGSLYVYGIHIDKNDIIISIISIDCQLIAHRKIKNASSQSSLVDILNNININLKQILKETEIDPSSVIAVGIALPGVINPETGVQLSSPQLGWRNLPIKNIAEQIFGLPVSIGNDVKCHAFCESYFSENTDNISYVFLHAGSGVGAVFVKNGEVLMGETGSAGEIGHIKIDAEGEMCDCGRIGCLQTHLTAFNIIKKAQQFDTNIDSISQVFKYVSSGVKWANDIIYDVVNYAEVSIGMLSALFDPNMIILGGSLFEENAQLFTLIENRYKDTQYGASTQSKLTLTALGETGIVLGAGILAVEEFFFKFDFDKK